MNNFEKNSNVPLCHSLIQVKGINLTASVKARGREAPFCSGLAVTSHSAYHIQQPPQNKSVTHAKKSLLDWNAKLTGSPLFYVATLPPTHGNTLPFARHRRKRKMTSHVGGSTSKLYRFHCWSANGILHYILLEFSEIINTEIVVSKRKFGKFVIDVEHKVTKNIQIENRQNF